MYNFLVNDMSCGHCASTITKAVKAVDTHARVQVDLDRHTVHIEDATADAKTLQQAIADAGYTPQMAT